MVGPSFPLPGSGSGPAVPTAQTRRRARAIGRVAFGRPLRRDLDCPSAYVEREKECRTSLLAAASPAAPVPPARRRRDRGSRRADRPGLASRRRSPSAPRVPLQGLRPGAGLHQPRRGARRGAVPPSGHRSALGAASRSRSGLTRWAACWRPTSSSQPSATGSTQRSDRGGRSRDRRSKLDSREVREVALRQIPGPALGAAADPQGSEPLERRRCEPGDHGPLAVKDGQMAEAIRDRSPPIRASSLRRNPRRRHRFARTRGRLNSTAARRSADPRSSSATRRDPDRAAPPRGARSRRGAPCSSPPRRRPRSVPTQSCDCLEGRRGPAHASHWTKAGAPLEERGPIRSSSLGTRPGLA